MNDVAPRAEACRNCGAVLHGRFCAACGQEARPLDPPFREVARDIGHELLDVDGRLLRSIRQLFLAPGFLTRELFMGRRVRWVTPLRLYLIFSVAYFALVAIGGTRIHATITATDGPEKIENDEQRTVAELKKYGYESEAVWMPRVNFLLVPLFAALVARVRRDSGRRYPQHLLFALHAHAAWFGARAVAALGTLVPLAIIGDVLDFLSMIYGMVYVAAAFRVAYDVPHRRAIRDMVVVLGIYFVCVTVATLAILLPAMFWRVWRPW
jgi:Protein of unknown function (DUF3667)